MNRLKILIVEDDLFICQDLREYLENLDYTISDVAYNARKAIAKLAVNLPDLVLIDIHLGAGEDGIQLAEHIREKYQIPFIYLTAYANKSVLERAKRTRPYGYIVKPFDERDLFANIEIALYNHAQRFEVESWQPERINGICKTDFTPKQVSILKDIFEGKTNRQLCEKHFISLNTVKTHVAKIYEKLQVHSRSEAMAALRKRLLRT